MLTQESIIATCPLHGTLPTVLNYNSLDIQLHEERGWPSIFPHVHDVKGRKDSTQLNMGALGAKVPFVVWSKSTMCPLPASACCLSSN